MQSQKLIRHLIRIHEYSKDDFRLNNLRNLVIKHLKKGNVLDVGSGTGHMTLEALKMGHEVTAIDISPEMVNFTKSECIQLGYEAKTIVLDVKNIETVGIECFDNVICLDLLEHIKDDNDVLKYLHSVLKEKGKLIINVPSLKFLYGIRDKEMGHCRRYDKGELIEKLKKNGFTIEKIMYFNFLGVFPYIIFEKVLQRKIYEDIRYQRGKFKNIINMVLNKWLLFETKIRVPWGLSLFVVATK